MLLSLISFVCVLSAPPPFTRGIIFGGLIVTINFHLLYRTLKKALTPPKLSSHNVVLVKYYLRFIASGIIIFGLLKGRLVDPIGLLIGLSVVVASITLATLYELRMSFLKETV
jgi:hypothetical protein